MSESEISERPDRFIALANYCVACRTEAEVDLHRCVHQPSAALKGC